MDSIAMDAKKRKLAALSSDTSSTSDLDPTRLVRTISAPATQQGGIKPAQMEEAFQEHQKKYLLIRHRQNRAEILQLTENIEMRDRRMQSMERRVLLVERAWKMFLTDVGQVTEQLFPGSGAVTEAQSAYAQSESIRFRGMDGGLNDEADRMLQTASDPALSNSFLDMLLMESDTVDDEQSAETDVFEDGERQGGARSPLRLERELGVRQQSGRALVLRLCEAVNAVRQRQSVATAAVMSAASSLSHVASAIPSVDSIPGPIPAQVTVSSESLSCLEAELGLRRDECLTLQQSCDAALVSARQYELYMAQVTEQLISSQHKAMALSDDLEESNTRAQNAEKAFYKMESQLAQLKGEGTIDQDHPVPVASPASAAPSSMQLVLLTADLRSEIDDLRLQVKQHQHELARVAEERLTLLIQNRRLQHTQTQSSSQAGNIESSSIIQSGAFQQLAVQHSVATQRVSVLEQQVADLETARNTAQETLISERQVQHRSAEQRAAVYSEQQVQIEQELWLTRSEHQVTLYRLQQYQSVRDQTSQLEEHQILRDLMTRELERLHAELARMRRGDRDNSVTRDCSFVAEVDGGLSAVERTELATLRQAESGWQSEQRRLTIALDTMQIAFVDNRDLQAVRCSEAICQNECARLTRDKHGAPVTAEFAATDSGEAEQLRAELEGLKMLQDEFEQQLSSATDDICSLTQQNVRQQVQLRAVEDANTKLAVESAKSTETRALLRRHQESLAQHRQQCVEIDQQREHQQSALEQSHNSACELATLAGDQLRRLQQTLVDERITHAEWLAGEAESQQRVQRAEQRRVVVERELEQAWRERQQAAAETHQARMEVERRTGQLERLQRQLESANGVADAAAAALSAQVNSVGHYGAGGGMTLGAARAHATAVEQEMMVYKKLLVCSVCSDRFKEVVITKCFHCFCRPCMKANLETRHRKCPCCGKSFGDADVKQLYLS